MANPFGDPQTMALLGLAQGLLAAGSPHPFPTSVGGALAQGMGGALNGAMGAQNYLRAESTNNLLNLQGEAMKRQQAAIEGLANTLPPQQRQLFLSDPGMFIRSTTEPYTLSPGQKRMMGGNLVAEAPPNLQMTDTGGGVQPVNPQTGLAAGPAIPKTMTPDAAASNAIALQNLGLARATLGIKAIEADPLGMLGARDVAATAGAPTGRTLQSPQTAAAGGGIPKDLHGMEFLQSIPQPVADQVKALAEGRMAFPAGFALKSPYWQNMISMVSQYDPQFDAVNYNSRARTRQDFVAGKSADNVTALNTAIYHLGSLEKNLESLNNTKLPVVNTVKNYLGEQAGNTAIQEAKKKTEGDIEAVSHELAKVFRSVGMSEGEVNSWKQKISTSASPAQRKAIISEALHLMEGRLQALGERYNRGMGTTADPFSLIDPKAKAVFDALKQSTEGKQQGGIKFLGFE